MLVGQVLIKKSNFFDANEQAITGGLRGLATGGFIGGLKEVGDDNKGKVRLQNISRDAALGGLGGALIGHFFDSHKHDIRSYVEALTENKQ